MGWFGFGKRDDTPQDSTPSAVQDDVSPPRMQPAEGMASGSRPEPQDAEAQEIGHDRGPQDAALHDTGPQDASPFELTVEDVFSIVGRGTVVTGRVASGSTRVGDELTLVRSGVAVLKVRLTGVEIFRTSIEVVNAGDNVGLLLHGIRREDVAAGDRLTH